MLVEAKTVVPGVTDRLVERRRLDEMIAALLEEHRVVGVWASAGAGKTTAVRQAVMALGWKVAWLTLDSSDAAPGRFLEYLRAALSRSLPLERSDEMVRGSQITHFEVAALLSQAMPEERTVVVIDEIERIADSGPALEVLSGFLRYLRPESRVVLIGRREVEFAATARLGFDAVGRVGEAELAFDTKEASTALDLRGISDANPERVVEATGGWVTGVLFEAWKSREHVGGSGGEADPLAGYLSAEILDGLDPDEREFLIQTSVYDQVTVARAEALGEADARRLLGSLRTRHLPVTWLDDGGVLRCHPRFREYLRSLLDRRESGLVGKLKHAFGRRLVFEGRHEEALEALLAQGRLVEALPSAKAAIPAAIARLDLDLVQSWIDRFGAAGLADEPFLLRAGLAVAVAHENFRGAIEMADALRGLGALGPAGEGRLEDSVFAVWSYWHVGRLSDAREVLACTPAGHARDLIDYVLSLVDEQPPTSIPDLTGGPLDVLTLRVSFARGRLREVLSAPADNWTPSTSERASALRAVGDLQATRSMLSEAPGVLANLRFEGMLKAELAIDLRQEHEAREALVAARKRIHDSGSLVLDTLSRLLAAKLELRVRRDPQSALVILRGIEASSVARTYRYLGELVDVWTGFALLLEGQVDQALARLRRATSAMVKAGRTLELSAAAVYLAEAEARAGNDQSAAAAAQLAIDTADRQGSRYALFQGLADFPAVTARQIETEDDPDSSWHEIGRSIALHGQARVLSPSPLAHLRDLGAPVLLCGGEERKARIAKAYALLAYLLESDGKASRVELLDALFDGRDDNSTRAYLRQAAQTLRAMLPDGIVLLREAETFLLQGSSRIETDTLRLRARLSSALTLVGDRRFEAAREVLDEHRGLEYLHGVNCSWVETRRGELAELLMSARIDAAVGAIQSSQYATASALLNDVVQIDPLREQAWRLLMRVAAAQGFDDRVIETYRRCERALTDIGLVPSAPTRQLIEGLRR